MTPDMSPTVGATCYDRSKKDEWIISTKRNSKVVIIGDSNMRLAKTHEADHFEVLAFPGAHLSHVYTLLYEAYFRRSDTDVVIAVGINHRELDFKNKTLPELSKVFDYARRLDQKVHFLGVSTAKEYPAIRELNKAAKARFGTRFIAPLPVDQVSIPPLDNFGIHHDAGTVDRILASIKIHLRQSRSLNE
jgi:hypothetical protein